MLRLARFRIPALFLALLISLALGIVYPVRSQSIDQLHNTGVQLYQQGDYEAAAGQFIEALKINPRAIAPLEYLGGALLRLERYEDAVDFLNQAKEINPFDPDTLFDLGVAYDYLGQLENASENYRQAAEEYQIRPESLDRVRPEELYNNLGITQLAQEDLSGALTSFQETTQLDPQYGPGYYLQGFTHIQRSEYPDATSAFDRSVAPDVEFDFRERGFNGKGVSQYFDGDLDQALDSLNESIQEAEQRSRTYPVAFSNRGLTHFDLGDLDSSEQDYDEVTTLDPENVNGYKDTGYVKFEIAEQARRIAKAGDPLELIATLPTQTASYYQARIESFAQHLAQSPEYRFRHLIAALPFSRSSLGLAPWPIRPGEDPLKDPIRLAQYALTDLANVKLKEAATSYMQAIQLDPNFAQAHYGLGAVFRSQKQFADALDEFKTARSLYQQFNDILWARFTEELDIPPLELRLEETILPEDLQPTPPPTPAPEAAPSTPAPAGQVRSGFTFADPQVLQFFDSDQLQAMVDQATDDAVATAVRREAVHALRLKQYRPAYAPLRVRGGWGGC